MELAKRIEAGLYAQHLLDCGATHHDSGDLRLVAEDGRAAFARFVEANVRLSAWFAQRRVAVRAGGGLSVEDLTAEGVVGVIRAVQKFDYLQGFKFSTYAGPWIRVFQQRAVVAESAAVLTGRDRRCCADMLGVRQDLTAVLGRFPTRAEVAARMRVGVGAVAEWEAMLAPAGSLDAPAGPDAGAVLGELIAAADPGAGPADDPPVDVGALLAGLTGRERSVLTEVFGLGSGEPAPVAVVAARRGVAPARVAALVGAALGKLRQAATHTRAVQGAAA